MNKVTEAASKLSARDDKLTSIFNDVFLAKTDTNPDYQATAGLAVDCALRLANVVLSARKNEGVLRGYMDLIVGLNGNPFWGKFSPILIHPLHSAMQAQADYALLRLEKSGDPNSTHSDELISEAKLAGLEIFTMILYCLGGHEMMALKSIELKKRLAAYFME